MSEVDDDVGRRAPDAKRRCDRLRCLGTLVEELRERTRLLHRTLDHSLPFMSPDLTLQQYTIALSRMYTWWAPTERAVSTLLNDAPISVRLQVRSTALLADLEHLGAAVRAEASRDQLPELASEAHAVGALYVLEGSALGGQIISRHLRRQLQLDERTGMSFFLAMPVAPGSGGGPCVTQSTPIRVR